MPTHKKLGRPPSGNAKRLVRAFLPPDLADWFMAIPPKKRSAWLAEQIEMSIRLSIAISELAPEIQAQLRGETAPANE
jgi:hypothetical protein